jgi:Phospholipase B
VDMRCDNGCRILYQAFAGFIWSGTDFFVTSAGIIGTETTIGGFLPFENNLPISCRIRQAMQYGKTLDDYVNILLKGNSGDYANSWMFGDIHSNEIMLLELGLKYHDVKRTKNGYFIGFNAPYNPQIRNLECANTGFDDIRRHQGARRVRLDDLMLEHQGKIDLAIAKQIISDHYDVYLNKTNPCSRTCCSHYDLDAREYMSDPARPKPFQPRGALDGCVIDSALARAMSFELRFGNSCGTPFLKDEFCNTNRQWGYLRPYLKDRPQQEWTVFSAFKKTKTKNNKTKKRRGK